MIVMLKNTKTIPAIFVHIENITEVSYDNGEIVLITSILDEALVLKAHNNLLVRVHNGYGGTPNNIIKNPTVEKLNKALKLDEL